MTYLVDFVYDSVAIDSGTRKHKLKHNKTVARSVYVHNNDQPIIQKQ